MPTKYGPQAKYDAENTSRVVLKLNHKTDSDIIAALDGKVKQTEAKRLIRKGIEAETRKD